MVGEGRVGWVVPRNKGVLGLRYMVSWARKLRWVVTHPGY
jgi:hypothetical protein